MARSWTRRIALAYRAGRIRAESARYFAGVVHNCARVSANNKSIAFVVHHAGIFGGPRAQQIDKPREVALSEFDNCVVVREGYVYELTKQIG